MLTQFNKEALKSTKIVEISNDNSVAKKSSFHSKVNGQTSNPKTIAIACLPQKILEKLAKKDKLRDEIERLADEQLKTVAEMDVIAHRIRFDEKLSVMDRCAPSSFPDYDALSKKMNTLNYKFRCLEDSIKFLDEDIEQIKEVLKLTKDVNFEDENVNDNKDILAKKSSPS